MSPLAAIVFDGESIAHLTPHTTHHTPHTTHHTPHTSHLTPHTSHLTPNSPLLAASVCVVSASSVSFVDVIAKEVCTHLTCDTIVMIVIAPD